MSLWSIIKGLIIKPSTTSKPWELPEPRRCPPPPPFVPPFRGKVDLNPPQDFQSIREDRLREERILRNAPKPARLNSLPDGIHLPMQRSYIRRVPDTQVMDPEVIYVDQGSPLQDLALMSLAADSLFTPSYEPDPQPTVQEPTYSQPEPSHYEAPTPDPTPSYSESSSSSWSDNSSSSDDSSSGGGDW